MARLLQTVVAGPAISLVTRKRVRLVALKQNKDLAYINELLETGKVKPVIDGPYTFDRVPEAFRLFSTAHHKGKIVITL